MRLEGALCPYSARALGGNVSQQWDNAPPFDPIPSMKKERRLTITIDLSKSGLLALDQFVHYNVIEDCNESRRDPNSQVTAL